jgi:hypothetical protein
MIQHTEIKFGGFGGLELFGFEDEAAAFVEVNPPLAGGAVGVVLSDGVFETIAAVARRVGMRHAEQVAKFGEEKLAIGAFGGAGVGPARDERGGGHGGKLKQKAESRKQKGERAICKRVFRKHQGHSKHI